MDKTEREKQRQKLYKELCELAQWTAASYYDDVTASLNEEDDNEKSTYLDEKGRIDFEWLWSNYGDQLGETLNELDDDFGYLGADRNEVYDVLYSYFDYSEIEDIFYCAFYDYVENIYGKEYVDQYRFSS